MTDWDQRFAGIQRLAGKAGRERLLQAHVCVAGVGGVGSWAAEALVRSSVGRLTLVDGDVVCVTNTNRQLHAVTGSFGQPKVEAMAGRMRAINPDIELFPLNRLLDEHNIGELLSSNFDYVIDAIDNPARKALLIASCQQRGIPVITSGGAAGRRDPSQIRVADLATASHDKLLVVVRRILRQEHGFPAPGRPFGVDCVYSPEPLVYAWGDGSVRPERDPETAVRPDCKHGLGTAAFVTGAFGFAAAGVVVRRIASEPA